MNFRRYHLPARCSYKCHHKRFHYFESELFISPEQLIKLNCPTSCWHYVIMDGKSPLPKPRLIDRLRAWWNGWSIN